MSGKLRKDLPGAGVRTAAAVEPSFPKLLEGSAVISGSTADTGTSVLGGS